MNNPTLTLASLTLAIALAFLPAGVLADNNQKVSETYFNGPVGDATFLLPTCQALLSQVCFTVPSGASQVTITIQDASGLPVSFFIDGESTSSCESATRTGLTPGDEIHVTANGSTFAALDCGLTTATTGTITASFS